jgi:hypothetical protein
MVDSKKVELDETTRRIAERMLHMPPKPHEEMKIGKPKPSKGESPAKRTSGKGRARVGKSRS